MFYNTLKGLCKSVLSASLFISSVVPAVGYIVYRVLNRLRNIITWAWSNNQFTILDYPI